MLIASSMLKHAAYPCLAELKYFQNWREKREGQLSVLTYHGVFPQGYKRRSRWLDGNLISSHNLRRQLTVLKSCYDVITPQEFKQFLEGDIALPRRAVLITCDDGLANVISDMLPVLESLDIKCLFFLTANSYTQQPGMLWYEELWLLLERVAAGNLDFAHPAAAIPEVPSDEERRHEIWWRLVRDLSKTNMDTRRDFIQKFALKAKVPTEWKAELLQDPANRNRFQLLNLADVQTLIRAGMTIGAHTISHPVLKLCAPEVAAAEIAPPQSIVFDASATQESSMWALAYPYGTHETVSDRERSMAAAAGYACAFMNTGGMCSPSANKFAIPRVNISGNMTLGEFEAHASGFHYHFQNRVSR